MGKNPDEMAAFDIKRYASTADIEALTKLYYFLQADIQRRIYEIRPHYKQMPETPHSFLSFVRERLMAASPVRVLDLGCHDAYLAARLREGLHPDSRLDCVDQVRQPVVYVSGNVTFHEADILTWIGQDRPVYDVAILGAVLSLFDEAGRARILDFLARHARTLFIREGPRYGTLIDVHFDAVVDQWRGYRLFSEHGLKAVLADHGFTVRTLEHEYDIYVEACSRFFSA